MSATEASFTRVYVELINQGRVYALADYAYGEYIAQRTFFDELSKVQAQIVAGEEVTLGSGQSADPNTTGGLIGIQIYTESLESARQTMSGLARLGLNVEKQVWKNI
jgi:hypothetical protein